ncbi:MAG: phage shock protein E [Sulfurimonas sp.]|jgi:phage shock protein E
MNENIIYVFIAVAVFIAYRKYTRHKVLQLVPALLEQGGQIVVVRTKDEFITAHKNGSINIPLESLNTQMNKLDKTKPIIICCASGSRSGLARRSLMSKGFDNVHNAGTWRSLIKFTD